MAKRIGICLLAFLLVTCAIAVVAKMTGAVDFTGLASARGVRGPAGQDGIDGVDGIDGRGISSISKTGTSGNVDTYTIIYTDSTTSSFNVTNGVDGSDGRSILSITKTATNGAVDTYTILFSDNTTSTFTVTNGSGSGGGNTWTKLSSGSGMSDPGTLHVTALSVDKVYEVCVVARHPIGDFTPSSTPVFFLNTDDYFTTWQKVIFPALGVSNVVCVLEPDSTVGNWTDFQVTWYWTDTNGDPDYSAGWGVDFYYREV